MLEEYRIPAATNFTFSGVAPEDLEEDAYTVATVGVDTSGSLQGQEALLKLLMVTIVNGLKKSSKSEKILLRVIIYNGDIGIKELHGFTPVDDIDLSMYDGIEADGMTPLVDAMFSAVASTYAYAKKMNEDDDDDYDANACVYIITDGMDNDSDKGMKDVQEQLDAIKMCEELESIILILMGVKDPSLDGTTWGNEIERSLKELQDNIDITEYVSAGDVTEDNVGKIGGVISESISSTSQALGSGGPSQKLPSKSF